MGGDGVQTELKGYWRQLLWEWDRIRGTTVCKEAVIQMFTIPREEVGHLNVIQGVWAPRPKTLMDTHAQETPKPLQGIKYLFG